MGTINRCYHCGSKENVDENDFCDKPKCQWIWEFYFKGDIQK